MNLLGSYANDYMIELKYHVDDEIMRILDAEVFLFFPAFCKWFFCSLSPSPSPSVVWNVLYCVVIVVYVLPKKKKGLP